MYKARFGIADDDTSAIKLPEFKLDLNLHFQLITNDHSIILNPKGIKLEQSQIKQSYEIVINQMLITHFWCKPDQEQHLWKFLQNAELVIYLSDANTPESVLYQVASGFAFNSFVSGSQNKV